jgi:uncharacterized membrane protein
MRTNIHPWLSKNKAIPGLIGLQQFASERKTPKPRPKRQWRKTQLYVQLTQKATDGGSHIFSAACLTTTLPSFLPINWWVVGIFSGHAKKAASAFWRKKSVATKANPKSTVLLRKSQLIATSKGCAPHLLFSSESE